MKTLNYKTQLKGILFFLVLSLFGLADGYGQTATPPANFNDPDAGTASNPYEIATLENLVWLQVETNAGNNFSNNKYFKQTADIDMISIPNWTPIGNTASSSESNKWFRGNYDGGNFKISNLTIDRPTDDVQGLFGWVEGFGTNEVKTNWTKLENIRLENVNVRGNDRVGAIVGFIKRTSLENSSVQGQVKASRERVGGLVGRSDPADLDNQLVFIGDVEGGIDTSTGLGSAVGIGGIVGRSSNVSSVSVAYVRGTVKGNLAGGIVGSTSTVNSTFSDMYAAVEVIAGSGQSLGGAIVGRIESTGDVINNTVYWDRTLFSNAYGSGTGGTRNAISRTTAEMQGSSAETNMNNLDWTTGPWRTVTLPTDDYPVFQWQLGDEISIAGQLTAANKSDLENITVRAQVGDVTFTDVTTTTDASGNYSFNAYSVPTQRVFARTTDDDGLPIGAAVNGPWTTSQTGINLDLQPRSLTISSAANSGWIKDGNEILAVEAGAVLNVNTLRDELLAGDVTIVAGVDVVFDGVLALDLPDSRALTLRAGKDIRFEQDAEITASNNPLNLVFWSDIDGNDEGMIWLRENTSITTNGGHLWMGGGEGSVTWNGLTVGDDYATGSEAFIPDDNTSSSQNGYNGITLDLDVTIQTGAGNIELNGRSGVDYAPDIGTGGPYSVNVGIYLGDGSQTSTTSGNVSMNGIGRLTGNQPTSGCSACGFRYGILFHRASQTSGRQILITSQSGNIALNGLVEDYTGTTTDRMNSGGVTLFAGTQGMVVSTDSGDIEIIGENQITTLPTGRIARGVWLTTGQTDVTSTSGSIRIEAKLGNSSTEPLALQGDTKIGDGTSGDIEIRSNRWTGTSSSTTRIAGSGELRILPVDEATTIGIAGASGTLSLSSTLFSTNFEPGFSNIIIGSENQTGNIACNTVTFRDHTTIQTDGNLTFGGNVTTNADKNLTLINDNLSFSSSRTFNIGGAFAYIPFGASFNNDVTFPMNNLSFSSPLKGLTIGKSGNDKNIEINIPINGDQSLNLFGEDISLNETIDVSEVNLEGNTTLVAGKYIASSGDFTHDGDLIFESNEDNGDAYLGTIGGNYTKTSGTVISEKFYPDRRAFRMVASPVNGGTIYDNWQNGGANIEGIGTHITGGSVENGFDQTTTNNASMYEFITGTGWQSVANTNATNLAVGAPYRLMVRGDRGIDLTSNESSGATTLVASGNLEVGTRSFTFPSRTGGSSTFAFVANPYQSRIDVQKVLSATANNNAVDNKYWVWDPMINTRGGFVTIDELTGNGSATPSSSATKFIEPGQAFFIQVTESNPSIQFTESIKDVTTSLSKPATFSNNQMSLLFELQNENNQVIDAIRLRFAGDGDNGVDNLDAGKMGNLDENLASINENSLFTIQHRSLPENDEVIPLFTNNWRNENYSFKANLANFEGTNVYVVDNYLGTETLLENGEVYHFSVDAGITESTNPLRFELKFDTISLGVEELDNHLFSLYPNPAKEVVNIQTSLALGSQVSVEIYNMLGQRVYNQKQTLKASNLQVNVNNFTSGVYLVNLTDEAGNKQSTQLIKE